VIRLKGIISRQARHQDNGDSAKVFNVVVLLMTNCQFLSILGDVMELKAMVRFLC
jgi:hypothetical protein